MEEIEIIPEITLTPNQELIQPKDANKTLALPCAVDLDKLIYFYLELKLNFSKLDKIKHKELLPKLTLKDNEIRYLPVLKNGIFDTEIIIEQKYQFKKIKIKLLLTLEHMQEINNLYNRQIDIDSPLTDSQF